MAGVAEPAKMALAQLTLEKLVSLVNSLRTAADKLLVFALMDATGMVRVTLARFYLHGALISTVLNELTDYVLSKLNAATGGLITAPSETMDGEAANLKRMERKDGFPSTLLALARVTAKLERLVDGRASLVIELERLVDRKSLSSWSTRE